MLRPRAVGALRTAVDGGPTANLLLLRSLLLLLLGVERLLVLSRRRTRSGSSLVGRSEVALLLRVELLLGDERVAGRGREARDRLLRRGRSRGVERGSSASVY